MSTTDLGSRVEAVARAHEFDAQMADIRDKQFTRRLALVGAVATIGPILVGVVVWLFNAGGAAKEAELTRDTHQTAIDANAEKLDKHITDDNKRWKELKKAVVENQVLILESIDHTKKQLRKITSKVDTVGESDVLNDARKAVGRAKAEQVLFDD